MSEVTQLGGDEAATWEKLDGALRLAAEAAYGGRYGDTMHRLRQAIEGATELGVYRSDGRWATAATRIEEARTMLAGVSSAAFQHAGPGLGAMMDQLHGLCVELRVRRVRH